MSDASYESTSLVIPLNYLFCALTAPIVVGPLRACNPRLLTMLGCLIITVAIFLSRWALSTFALVLLFGVLAGVGEGFIFLTPLRCALLYYPRHQGLVTGLNFAGLSLGLFFFSELYFVLINPHNARPSVVRQTGSLTELYYGPEVADNFPLANSVVALVLVAISSLAGLFVRTPGPRWLNRTSPLLQPEEEVIQKPLRVRELLASCTFWKLYLMAVLASFFGSYMYSVAKPYGLMMNGDDQFNTLALTVAGLAGGSLRFLWTWAIDHYGFQKVGLTLFLTIIFVASTLPMVASSKPLFFIYVILSVACDAAIIAVFPAVCTIVFGIHSGTLAFSFIFSGIALILVGGSLFSQLAVSSLGYPAFFYGSAVATAIALGIHFAMPIYKSR